MNPISNYDSVEAISTEKKRLGPGGYVCKVTKVEDVADREYLKMEYDIVEGEFKGYWSSNEENYGWRDSFIRSYKDKALGFFKQFMNSVESSNSGFRWEWNEKALVGKLIGIVLAEEEYERRDGDVGTRLRVAKVASIDDIRSGHYTVPEKKVLTTRSVPVQTANEDDLPFDF